MSERSFPQDGPEAAGGRLRRGPKSVIADYFLHVERPTSKDMNAAAGLIEGPWREHESTRDTLNICIDLATRIPDATTVLAGMFDAGHEAIPTHWQGPDEARAVLSMVADVEIGILNAQQRSVVRGPALPGFPERLAEVQQFVGDLQGQ